MIIEDKYKSGDTVNRVCNTCSRHDVIKKYHKIRTNVNECRCCSRKYTDAAVHKIVNQYGFVWLSGFYKNNRSILEVKCACGNIFSRNLHGIAKCVYGCVECELAAQSDRVAGSSNPMYGRVGELNPAYNDGLSNERRIARRYDKKIQKWSLEVKHIAEFTCDCCGKIGNGDLESHHLYNYVDNVSKAIDIDNGVCLCKKCHSLFHKKHGKVSNTPNQYIEFKGEYNVNKE